MRKCIFILEIFHSIHDSYTPRPRMIISYITQYIHLWSISVRLWNTARVDYVLKTWCKPPLVVIADHGPSKLQNQPIYCYCRIIMTTNNKLGMGLCKQHIHISITASASNTHTYSSRVFLLFVQDKRRVISWIQARKTQPVQTVWQTHVVIVACCKIWQ